MLAKSFLFKGRSRKSFQVFSIRLFCKDFVWNRASECHWAALNVLNSWPNPKKNFTSAIWKISLFLRWITSSLWCMHNMRHWLCRRMHRSLLEFMQLPQFLFITWYVINWTICIRKILLISWFFKHAKI